MSLYSGKEMERLRDRVEALLEAGTALAEPLGRTISESAQCMRRRLESAEPCSDLLALEFVETAWRLCLRLQREKDQSTGEAGERRLRIERSKLEVVAMLLPYALEMPCDDLFNLKRSHPRWQSLLSQVAYIPCKDLKSLQAGLADMHRLMFLSGSALALGLRTANFTMKKLLTGSGVLYYGVKTEEAVQQGRLNAACPTIPFLRLFLGLAESSLCAALFDSLLPEIALSKRIYIPRGEEDGLTPSEAFPARLEQGDIREDEGNPKDYVAVRVISPFPLPALQPIPTQSHWFLCCHSDQSLHPVPATSIILHIHGGGWTAMSSHTHENHTRKWSLSTNAVVLSVDYRLAPEWPYPAAVQDCWAAYKWARQFAKRKLGLEAEKVVLAGDSAGGNLALAVAFKAIERGYQPPDGLLLIYPSLSTDLTRPTPSYLYSLEDFVLSHGIMRLSRESYLSPASDPHTDPLLSPLCASDALLAQLPPVRLLIGSNDPLVDDSWRFFERLQRLHVNSSLTVFEGLSHGLLNFDFKLGLPEAQQAVTVAGQKLQELLHRLV